MHRQDRMIRHRIEALVYYLLDAFVRCEGKKQLAVSIGTSYFEYSDPPGRNHNDGSAKTVHNSNNVPLPPSYI
jgi:hypothetical protein